jgi:hypothetical protein
MAHSLYPFFMRIAYSSGGHQHNMTVPLGTAVLIGESPAWELENHIDGHIAVQTAMNDLGNALIRCFGIGCSLGEWTLWEIARSGSDPDWVFSDPIWRANGGFELTEAPVAGNITALSQTTFSYRTSVGGRYKMVLMESIYGPDTNLRSSQINPLSGMHYLNEYILSTLSIVFGRDGGYPNALVRVLGKTSDALRKTYFA